MPTGKKSLLLFSGYHWFACTLTTSQTTTTFQPSKWLWRLQGGSGKLMFFLRIDKFFPNEQKLKNWFSSSQRFLSG